MGYQQTNQRHREYAQDYCGDQAKLQTKRMSEKFRQKTK